MIGAKRPVGRALSLLLVPFLLLSGCGAAGGQQDTPSSAVPPIGTEMPPDTTGSTTLPTGGTGTGTTGSASAPGAPVTGSAARTTAPSGSTSVGAPKTTHPTSAATTAATTRARVPLSYAAAVVDSGIGGGVRDPFVLLHDGVYYMYTTWWQLYISDRLDGGWLGPYTCVTPPDGYDGDPWAPEVYAYGGAFYMFASYHSSVTGSRGCAVFRAERPDGPFTQASDGHVTPHGVDAIDGTLVVDEDGQPWMVWCGEHTGTPDRVGRMLCAPMSRDLTRLTAAPTELFRADDAPWATNTVTDGCFLYRCADGTLLMLWSNRDNGGYCVGVAVSDSGKVTGPWRQESERLYTRSLTGRYDGGHGMIFRDKAGALWMAIHSPNSASAGRQEMPVFIPLIEEGGRLRWDLLSR